jgi:CheY-like chemotaxis protein
MLNSRPVLLVEDDDVDTMTIKRALKHLKVPNHLVHLKDGKEALEYLQAKTYTKPSIIILDLNTPRMNGLELLKIIKVDDVLKMIPVVVLTTSEADQDIEESFSLSVAGYIVKPVDFDKFVTAFRTFHLYWSLCELPNG